VAELRYAKQLGEKRLAMAEAEGVSLRRMLASYEKEADMKAPPVRARCLRNPSGPSELFCLRGGGALTVTSSG
jgi:hypothetical protein